jgi:hypothetical protein
MLGSLVRERLRKADRMSWTPQPRAIFGKPESDCVCATQRDASLEYKPVLHLLSSTTNTQPPTTPCKLKFRAKQASSFCMDGAAKAPRRTGSYLKRHEPIKKPTSRLQQPARMGEWGPCEDLPSRPGDTPKEKKASNDERNTHPGNPPPAATGAWLTANT